MRMLAWYYKSDCTHSRISCLSDENSFCFFVVKRYGSMFMNSQFYTFPELAKRQAKMGHWIHEPPHRGPVKESRRWPLSSYIWLWFLGVSNSDMTLPTIFCTMLTPKMPDFIQKMRVFPHAWNGGTHPQPRSIFPVSCAFRIRAWFHGEITPHFSAMRKIELCIIYCICIYIHIYIYMLSVWV